MLTDCDIYDNPTANVKISGGQFAEIADNYIWGKGAGFETYGNPRFIRFHHNTVWMSQYGHAVETFTYQTDSEWRDNILVSSYSGYNEVMIHSWTDTNQTNRWHGNVLAHTIPGKLAVQEYDGIVAYSPRCDGWIPGHPIGNEAAEAPNYIHGYDVRNGHNPPPTPCLLGRPANPNALTADAAGLAAWRAGGDRGEWFGPRTDDRSWGLVPSIVQSPPSSRAHLQILSTDTVARPYGAGARTGLLP